MVDLPTVYGSGQKRPRGRPRKVEAEEGLGEGAAEEEEVHGQASNQHNPL